MDAVADANGNPICRVASPTYDPQYYKSFSNCAPINLFGGWNNISPQAAAYVSGPQKMAEQYYDTWMNAMNAGTAVAYPDNPVQWMTRTRRGRIDYVWLSKGTSAVVDSTQIPDVRDLSNTNVVEFLGTLDDKGVRPSDHNPMIANIRLQ